MHRTAFSLLIVATLPLFAQTNSTTQELQSRAKKTVQDPLLSSALTSALSQVTLVSSGDDTSLRAEAGIELGEWSLGLRVQTAIEEGQNKADLVDLDGLTGGSKATLTATRLSFGSTFNPTRILRVCDDYNQQLGKLGPVPPGPKGCADLLAARVAEWDKLEQAGQLTDVQHDQAIRDRALNQRAVDAVTKALEAICSEFNVDGGHILEDECRTVVDAKAILPDPWDKKLDNKILELRAPLCAQACAATFADRVAKWDERARMNPGKLSAVEKAQDQRDRDWNDRILNAEQEALTTICTDYNKTGADPPILPEDCRNADAVKRTLPDAWDEKLDEKIDESMGKICQEFNSTQPASWGWINTSDTSECKLSTLEGKGDDWALKAVQATGFSPRVLSFSASIDRQDFKYIVIGPLDPTVPPKSKLDDPTEESKFGFAVTVSAGKLLYYNPQSPLYLGGGVTLTRAFKSGPEKQICLPSDTSDVTLCEDIVTAAPKEDDKQTAYIEARVFPSKKFGLIPRLTYEFENEVAGAQLTAFFLTHETKGLNGGLDLAYRDDGKGLVARLFIGASFSIFPGAN